jgi:hypothetical protein
VFSAGELLHAEVGANKFAPGSRLRGRRKGFLREAMRLIMICTCAVSSLKKSGIVKKLELAERR